LYAEPGTDFVLAMNVSANPKPDNVYWTIEGKKYVPGETFERYTFQRLVEVEV